VLQAESGRRAGHRIWLGANQRVFVGGTEWAEFAVPGDPQLADVQFVVESDFLHCRIRNLFADQALLVNGKEIEERTLVNGDIVTAGTTRFSVGIQESPEAERRRATIHGDSPRPSLPDLQYRAERCESGLLRFYAADQALAPNEVALLLAQQHGFYLIVHMQKAGLELPARLNRVVDLGARGEVDASQLNPSSLVMLSPSDPIDRFQLLEQGWNRDAIVGVFSTRERPAVIQSLLRAPLWAYPAHIIRDQLLAASGTHIQELFKGIKAILVESPSQGGWEVFASPRIDPLWMQLGFPNSPASKMAGSVDAVGTVSSWQAAAAGSARPTIAAGSPRAAAAPGSARPPGLQSARPA
jgi:hypothetical protein